MRRVIIAITGASGVIYGIRALELLRAVDDVETHAIITPSAFRTALAEVDYEPDQIKALADRLYNQKGYWRGHFIRIFSYQWHACRALFD